MTSAEGAAEGKRNGNVQFEIIMSDEYASRLEGIASHLNEVQSAIKYDKRSLAQLLAGLQQFMEDALGINSMYKSQPKLPASIFRDLSASGPLLIIGTICAEVMKNRGMKRIDWSSPALRKENLELVSRLRQELLRGGFIQQPKVHIHKLNGATDSLRLSHIVAKLGGDTLSAEDSPGVTHIVVPFGPAGDPDDGQTYLRAQERQGGLVRVHWWYLPDSYDEWIPALSAPEELQPDRPRRGPWRVYARWILDSEKHNEWMNPVDYETEEAASAAEEGAKRGREEDGVEEASKKARLAAATRGNVEIAPDVEPVNVAPGVVRQTIAQPSRRALSGVGALDISQGQHRVGSAPIQANPPADTKPMLEAYLVPSCAGWFRWGAIHEFERSEFPEFFSTDEKVAGSGRTPEAYIQYRNAMIDKYREDPLRELTFTEARRWLAGDVGTLRRIHAFLHSWGLINARAQIRAGRLAAAGGPETVLEPAAAGSVKPDAAVDAALAGANGGRVAPAPRPGFPRPAAAQGVQYYCNAMPWVNCTALRYHCTKLPDVDLCPLAYAEGRFPPGCTAHDFVKIESTEAPPDPSGWTNEEQLLLLEGVEKHGEDWAAIAEFVGTKNPMQCCTRFLQMPIEEAILAEGMASNGQRGWVTIPDPGNEDEEAEAAGPIPFADVGNPIMAQLAFLTTMVGPKVAAAAAQRALEVLAEEDDAFATLSEAATEVKAEEELQGVGSTSFEAPLPISAPRLRAAAATALAAAAAKAKLLADAEEREMQRLVLAAVDVQCKKINLKLQHLEKLDEVMARERAQLESLRSTFIASHLSTATQPAGEAVSEPAPMANGMPQAGGIAAEASELGHPVPVPLPVLAPGGLHTEGFPGTSVS